jgi:myosin heavy subunit
MAREIDQKNLPKYTGRFSWIAANLHSYIKEVRPDYNSNDPKTWPLVTTERLQQILGRTYSGRQLLPLGVAYERDAVQLCVSRNPDKIVEVKRTDDTIDLMNLHFQNFPFIYNRFGQRRSFEYMPADQYVWWVFGMTGSMPQTRTRSRVSAFTFPSEEAPNSTFNEIIGMLREQQSDSATEQLEVIQQELIVTKKELAEEMTRAHAAKKDQIATKSWYKKSVETEKRRAEAELQEIKNKLTKERTHHSLAQASVAKLTTRYSAIRKDWLENTRLASQANLKVQKMEKALDKRNQVLEAVRKDLTTRVGELETAKKETLTAKKEAAAVKELIKKIRDEMKKAKGIEAQKRKATNDASGSEVKRIRREIRWKA